MNKESDLYIPIKRFFQANGFDVYSEVTVRYSGGRVDIVANNYPAPIAIELKTNLSMDLIGQAIDRKKVFPYVYVAIPERKRGASVPRWILQHLKEQKIGLLMVDPMDRVRVVLPARYDRAPLRHKVDWEWLLKPEHQEWVPGGHSGGGYVTPYRVTMKGVETFLKKMRRNHPDMWLTINHILEHCETHYMQPKPSLSKALLEFEIGWIDAKKINNRWHFQYKGDE